MQPEWVWWEGPPLCRVAHSKEPGVFQVGSLLFVPQNKKTRDPVS